MSVKEVLYVLEDIIDKIKEKAKKDKASIIIKLLLLLGVILGYFIDDRLGGDFTGWYGSFLHLLY